MTLHDPEFTNLESSGIKLYVDDWRHAPFGWMLARTITEAIEILSTQDVSIVSLDYDIEYGIRLSPDSDEAEIVEPEDEEYQAESPEKFTPVARFIATMKERPTIQFHTTNAEGEIEMREILRMNPEPNMERIKSQRFIDESLLSVNSG